MKRKKPNLTEETEKPQKIKQQPADSEIEAEADELVRAICENWGIDDTECLIYLQRYREQFILYRKAEREVKHTGLTLIDRFKQRKVNPACLIQRDALASMLRILKDLNLDLEPLQEVGRPPGS